MPRRTRSLIISGGIVAFWLVMMGLLVQREVFVPRAQSGNGAPGAFDSWMGIYVAPKDGPEKRVGFVHSESRRESRDGVEGTASSLTVKLAVMMLAAPTEVVVTGTTWTSDASGLAQFAFKIRSFEHSMRVSGEVDDGVLELAVETAGMTYPLSIPVGDDLFVSGNMGTTTLNVPNLEVGQEVLVDTFDPMTLSSGKTRIACIAEETLTIHGDRLRTKVLNATLGGVTTKVWVTDAEETIRVETPYGFILQKTTQADALAALDEAGTEELLNAMAVRPTGKQPVRGAKRMTIRITNVPSTAEPPSDDIQRRLGPGFYEIMPARSEVTETLEDPSEYLEGDPFVQVEHPDIAALAAEITAGAESEWEKAQRIYTWVHENIEKIIVLSFPSAIEVLETREGDCNEHTVLYTALARSAGVPTRMAIGIVWSEALGAFYYHAWPEVYHGRWIPMDPTLGQEIADATHVKLLNGNIEKWPQLVPYLGQIQIEVLDIE